MTLEQMAIRSAFARPELRLSEETARTGGRMGLDYDYSKSDPVKRLLDPRGHGSDAGKLPWHPTFSNQSSFVSKNQPGGVWGRDFMGDTFRPSERMIRQPGYNDRITDYMRRSEPNVRLIK